MEISTLTNQTQLILSTSVNTPKIIAKACVEKIFSAVQNCKTLATRKCQEIALAFEKSPKKQIANLEKEKFALDRSIASFQKKQLTCIISGASVTSTLQAANYEHTISEIETIEKDLLSYSNALSNLLKSIEKHKKFNQSNCENELKAVLMLNSFKEMISKLIFDQKRKDILPKSIIDIETKAVDKMENDIIRFSIPLSVIQPNLTVISGKRFIIESFKKQMELNEKFTTILTELEKKLLGVDTHLKPTKATLKVTIKQRQRTSWKKQVVLTQQ